MASFRLSSGDSIISRENSLRRIVVRCNVKGRDIGSISLIPFIISSGTGAEIEKPLAIVVVGGLVTRRIKIVILPMVYEWVERRAARRAEATAV